MIDRLELKSRLGKAESEVVRVCRDLVRIPSENPPGDTTEAFAYVQGLLERWRFRFALLRPARGRQNLIATWDTGRPGRHLVLNGHLDVFPAGPRAAWERDPFSGTVQRGRLYGRGSTDMKAGVTASLFTLRMARDYERQLDGKVTLTLVCDEETFAEHGARYLLARHPECVGDALLNGEPGCRMSDKGFVWAEATFRTGGGHAAYAHLGESAIHRANQFINAVRGIERWPSPLPPRWSRQLRRIRDVMERRAGRGASEVARRYVVTVGMINGGVKVNMMAPECAVQVDCRIPVGGRVKKVVGALREAARTSGGRLRVINSTEPSASDLDHEIFTIVKRAADEVNGARPTVFCFGLGCTDARLWRYRGVPAVVYGPTAHHMGAPNEFLEVRELLGTAAVHSATALEFLRRPAYSGPNKGGAS